jgi:hypothetical protein
MGFCGKRQEISPESVSKFAKTEIFVHIYLDCFILAGVVYSLRMGPSTWAKTLELKINADSDNFKN